MKLRTRLFIFSVILLIVPIFLFANQKYYYHDSPEYVLTKLISNVSKSSGPSIVTPVSGDSLLKTLMQIDRSKIPANAISAYDNLVKSLSTPRNIVASSDFGADVTTTLNLELYGNTNPQPEDSHVFGNSIYEQKDRKAIFNISAEGWWNEYVYGKFSFDVKKTIQDDYLAKSFTSNIPSGNWGSMQLVSPFDTGISLGTDFFNVFIGRGRLNIGNGKTGNLFIADNFNFQDFGKFSLDSKYFDYDFTYTHFDQQTSELGFEPWMTFNGKHQIRLSHHYTANVFNRIKISFHEGTLIQSDSALDLRMFNPFIFMHNWQGFYNSALWANNFVAAEINANLGLGLTTNFQVIADQVQLGSEVEGTEEGKLHPDAWGFLWNLTYTTALKKGFLESYIEAAYTMPSLYLNNLSNYNAPSDEQDNPNWYKYNYDLILGYFASDYNYGDISYTGYKFGPDTIAVALGSHYITYEGKLDASIQALLKIHGEKGINWYGNNSSGQLGDLGIANVHKQGPTGIPEYMLELKTGVTYSITDYLKVNALLGYRHYWNYQNKLNLNHDTMQYSIGFSFTPTAFIPAQNK